MRIAVAGGTGTVGRLVVEAVREAGHEPVVISRAAGVDLLTGAGLDDALRKAETVIDVANTATFRRRTSEEFFGGVTRRLLDAGARAGVSHLVVLSIVGIDRVDLGYYAGKRVQEELVTGGPLPFSLLRATQFHEFAAQMVDRSGPVVPVPRMPCQPVAAREVARALAELACGEPVGRAPDLAGPERLETRVMVRRLLAHRGRRRLVLPVPVPGSAGRQLASGGLLPDGPGPRGTETFEQWLHRTGAAPAQ